LDYEPRTYRTLHSDNDLFHFQVVVGETDLDIAVRKENFSEELKKKAEAFVCAQRNLILEYIKVDPVFFSTLKPHCAQPQAPAIIEQMCEKAAVAGVGPMAAVAGLFSEIVGKWLSRYSSDIIVENGGDIWLKSSKKRSVAIYAGQSPLSCRVGVEISPMRTPLGICTSSGTVGHSLSFGRADAVVILAPSAVLADAVATAAGNIVQSTDDLEETVRFACDFPGVTGAIAIIGDRMAVFGDVKLIPV